MANSSLTISSIDFDTLKNNLKTFLSTQTVFKDYNFEGSNINVLLDVMSYNSYLNSFYMNMVASEMFLDSAQKYDSVISHAKELNYLPISAKSSYANVNISLETEGLSGSLTIPKGTRFSGTNANNTYTFATREVQYVVSPNNTFSFNNLVIYEGIYIKESFVYDTTQETQLIKLSNKNIDIDSITVTVTEDDGAVVEAYNRASSLFGLNKNSKVYFLQGSDNNKYEIVFGDDILGRKPKNMAIITVEYMVNNGSKADGVSIFSISDDLSNTNGGKVLTTNVTSVFASRDGADQENIESIKFNAPRHFTTQYRAISSEDYASIILSKYGGKISDVIIYGGQDLEPKQYGRVVVSLKPNTGTVVSETLKNEIKNYLLDFIALPNRVIVSDPDTIYCSVETIVQFNVKASDKSLSQIKSLVGNGLLQFSKDHLEKFGNDLRYSRLVRHIDETDTAITSNDTHVKMIKRIFPEYNIPTSFEINFNNAGEKELNGLILTSDLFTYVLSEVNYTDCYFRDDQTGKILICKKLNNEELILNSNAGTINYATGKITLSKFTTSFYKNFISLYFNPLNKDIIATKNMILYLDPAYITVNIIETIK